MFEDGELVWFCITDNFGPQKICKSFYGRIIGTNYFCEYDDNKTIYEIQAEYTVCGKPIDVQTFEVEESMCFKTETEADRYRDKFNEENNYVCEYQGECELSCNQEQACFVKSLFLETHKLQKQVRELETMVENLLENKSEWDE